MSTASATAVPAASEARNVSVPSPQQPVPVTEGSATILFPSPRDVFYNPVQQFNRDLSTLAIRTWSHGFLAAKTAAAQKRTAGRGKKRKRGEKQEEDVSTTVPQDTNGVHTPDVPQQTFTILEALSATGLRAIRYAQEIPNVEYVLANDLSTKAVAQIRRNCDDERNSDVARRVVRPHEGDARVVMYKALAPKDRFDVVDLDPYGSAAPFLDGAVQSVSDGGLLLVTCTDLAVLAGDSHPEKCFSQYGGANVRQSEFCHELALRLLINSIRQHAARYGRTVTPLLSLSIDFYIRVFVRVETSAKAVKRLASETSLVYACTGCRSYTLQPMGVCRGPPSDAKPGTEPRFTHASARNARDKCDHCGFPTQVGGPMYDGPLHDPDFCTLVLAESASAASEDAARESRGHPPWYAATRARVAGMVSLAIEENSLPSLLYALPRLAKTFHTQQPPFKQFLSAFLNANHKVSGSHTKPAALKTTAPSSFIWDVMRAWIARHAPVKKSALSPTNAGWNILFGQGVPQSDEGREYLEVVDKFPHIDFTIHPDAELRTKKQGLVRYQDNPTDNWGPKVRARGPDERRGGGGRS
ncbi:RNA methyltransferase tRNA(m5U54)methyltransferase [Savitreella phatthalungensis]